MHLLCVRTRGKERNGKWRGGSSLKERERERDVEDEMEMKVDDFKTPGEKCEDDME